MSEPELFPDIVVTELPPLKQYRVNLLFVNRKAEKEEDRYKHHSLNIHARSVEDAVAAARKNYHNAHIGDITCL